MGALLLLLPTIGCGDDGAPAPARGVDNPRGPAAGRGPRARPPRSPGDKQEGFVHPSAVAEAEDEVPGEAPADEPGAGTPNDDAERDLSADLREAIGDPSACLATAADLPARLTVSVEAHVSATGLVTRAEVSAPGMPESAAECMRERVQAARLAGPVEDAPRPVRTSLVLERGGS